MGIATFSRTNSMPSSMTSCSLPGTIEASAGRSRRSRTSRRREDEQHMMKLKQTSKPKTRAIRPAAVDEVLGARRLEGRPRGRRSRGRSVERPEIGLQPPREQLGLVDQQCDHRGHQGSANAAARTTRAYSGRQHHREDEQPHEVAAQHDDGEHRGRVLRRPGDGQGEGHEVPATTRRRSRPTTRRRVRRRSSRSRTPPRATRGTTGSTRRRSSRSGSTFATIVLPYFRYTMYMPPCSG